MTDEHEPDWLRIVREECCVECHLEASAVPRDALTTALGVAAAAWSELLSGTAEPDLHRRLGGGGWTALEYGAHVRDVFRVFDERLSRILTEDEPELGWWDHGAAAVDERYDEQDPTRVADELVADARSFAEHLDAVPDDAWDRAGTRQGRERFTVDALARFALHEAVHHLHDAEVASAR